MFLICQLYHFQLIINHILVNKIILSIIWIFDNNRFVLAIDPPTYAETLTGAVDIRDEDDDQYGTMGDLTYTPMYTYVYDYRYKPPPAYSEVSV